MSKSINAIYENGILRPLEPIDIEDHTMVRITIEVAVEREKEIEEILELARKSYEGLSENERSIIENSRFDFRKDKGLATIP